MIKSMTGYGKSETQIEGKKITIEIRSLNSKQLDLSVKMPSAYRQTEYDVRNMVSKGMQRGKVDVYINVDSETCINAGSINEALFAQYYHQLSDIAKRTGVQWGTDAIDAAAIQTILRLPEVVSNDSAVISDSEKRAISEGVTAALAHINQFREQEGKILMNDLLERVDKIRSLKEKVTPFAEARCEVIKNRIRESVEASGVQVDNNRLEQEIVFYIEKLDITEEKVRLENHCKYFHEVAGEEEGVGRKLGFIAQEMGREINTLGSKANDASIQRFVVEMKDELEKIKEQLLNIL